MDLTNKSLALLLIAAIVISLGGTIISLNKLSQVPVTRPIALSGTGRAAATGNVSLVIGTNASCNIDANVSYGTGAATVNRTLSTDASNAFDGWTCVGTTYGSGCSGMVINNTGNVLLNVSYNSSVNGTGLLLSAGQNENDFTYTVDDTTEPATADSNSCLLDPVTDWANVNYTNGNNGSNICSSLNFTANSSITIDYNVTVTSDTTPGIKSATIYIACTQA